MYGRWALLSTLLLLLCGCISHNAVQPVVTCQISTVSYRFVGDAGTAFRYDGRTWSVPKSGWIELIASKRTTEYQVDGRSLPLDVWPRDQFGTRTVPLPARKQEIANE